MLRLKQTLETFRIPQRRLARAVNVSPATIAQVVNHNLWPKAPEPRDLKEAICLALLEQVGDVGWSSLEIFLEVEAQPASRASDDNVNQEDSNMLPRKAKFTQEAVKAFRILRDPFRNEIQEAADVFMSSETAFIFEAMWQSVQSRQTDFVGIVGESGSGKSTLRDELLDRIKRENHKVHVIQPASIAAMEASDKKGKTLKAASIAEAIIGTVAPQAKIPRTPEALYRAVTTILQESARAGFRHMLIIDEAHCLPTPTLKHLKRFYEFKDGHQGLLSIVLIGQPELAMRLDETNPEVREVTQRCWLTRLEPLDTCLEAYVAHKFERAGRKASEFLEADAYTAMREVMLFRRSSRKGSGHISYLYPLAVNNLLIDAINYAAKIGEGQKVDAGVIKGVKEEL